MRHFAHRTATLLVLTAILVLGSSVADADVIEDYPGAVINWTNGSVHAQGRTPAPIADRGQAIAQARSEALKSLLDTLMMVRVDADHRGVDIVSQNKVLRSKIEQLVRQAAITTEHHANDGMAEVAVQLSLAGPLSQLLLPEGIRQLDSIRTVSPTGRGTNGGKHVYTRLIVDARGLDLKPALSLRITDESGQQVYGPAFISRDFAVERRVCSYARFHPQMDQPMGAEDKPLMVKGLRMQGAEATDVVISKADAARIHSASEHLTFLRQCRVVIVTD